MKNNDFFKQNIFKIILCILTFFNRLFNFLFNSNWYFNQRAVNNYAY